MFEEKEETNGKSWRQSEEENKFHNERRDHSENDEYHSGHSFSRSTVPHAHVLERRALCEIESVQDENMMVVLCKSDDESIRSDL